MSNFDFSCPHCQESLCASGNSLGATIECPTCHGAIQLPTPDRRPPPPLPQIKTDNQPRQKTKVAGFGFDAKAVSAQAKAGSMYIVIQVVLTEKLLGTGSGTSSLTSLQAAINKQAAQGYRLHTISTTSSGSKGFLGGDKIQATMVFEKIL